MMPPSFTVPIHKSTIDPKSHLKLTGQPNPVTDGLLHNYSPKSRRTLRKTLSFSGSYGWSLLGISSTAGKAAVYVSTLWRIRSAIWESN